MVFSNVAAICLSLGIGAAILVLSFIFFLPPITIPFTITHKSHSPWQWVTVSNFHQNTGTYVHGKYVEVDIKGISPSSAMIWPNSSVREEMTLSIPSSAPDDIVGKSVTVSLQFDTEVAFGGSYRGRADSINLQVVA